MEIIYLSGGSLNANTKKKNSPELLKSTVPWRREEVSELRKQRVEEMTRTAGWKAEKIKNVGQQEKKEARTEY